MCSENNLGVLSYCNIRAVETTIHIVKAVFYIESLYSDLRKIMIFYLQKEIEIIYYYSVLALG